MTHPELYPEHLAEELADEIEQCYARHRIKIGAKVCMLNKGWFVVKVKLKGATRISQVLDRASDIKFKLKLHTFKPFIKGAYIFIVVSEQEIKHDSFYKVIVSPTFAKAVKKMKLPYYVGVDGMGENIVVDLDKFNHLLIGGSSGSGKTVALLILILSLIICTSEKKVNLLIIDVGANDLTPFNGISHLSCPVIRDITAAINALMALMNEMEWRKELEVTDIAKFKLLPKIVCVIDEFPTLMLRMGKQSKLLTAIISNLLQLGRHYGIHLVIAAQNPTFQNMKIDLSNITARIASTCAKSNFSKTILDEEGAEKLSGKGDLYFKSPNHDGLQRIQGTYITPNELKRLLHKIKSQSHQTDNPYKFVIDDETLQQTEIDTDNAFGVNTATTTQNDKDELLAQIIVWALERETISCNQICDIFGLGWKRASGYLQRLRNLGIVGDLDAKLPRAVLPVDIGDFSIDTISLLERNGYATSEIKEVLDAKRSDSKPI